MVLKPLHRIARNTRSTHDDRKPARLVEPNVVTVPDWDSPVGGPRLKDIKAASSRRAPGDRDGFSLMEPASLGGAIGTIGNSESEGSGGDRPDPSTEKTNALMQKWRRQTIAASATAMLVNNASAGKITSGAGALWLRDFFQIPVQHRRNSSNALKLLQWVIKSLRKQLDIAKRLSATEIQEMVLSAEWREYEEGSTLFEKGMEGSEMFMLLNGTVELFLMKQKSRPLDQEAAIRTAVKKLHTRLDARQPELLAHALAAKDVTRSGKLTPAAVGEVVEALQLLKRDEVADVLRVLECDADGQAEYSVLIKVLDDVSAGQDYLRQDQLIPIKVLQPGTTFGEYSLFHNQRRTVSARARLKVEAIVIFSATFEKIFRQIFASDHRDVLATLISVPAFRDFFVKQPQGVGTKSEEAATIAKGLATSERQWQWTDLMPMWQTRVHEAGTVVLEVGAPKHQTQLGIVVWGCCKLVREMIWRQASTAAVRRESVTIVTVSAGECFNVLEAIRGLDTHYQVIAETPVKVLMCQRKDFLEMMPQPIISTIEAAAAERAQWRNLRMDTILRLREMEGWSVVDATKHLESTNFLSRLPELAYNEAKPGLAPPIYFHRTEQLFAEQIRAERAHLDRVRARITPEQAKSMPSGYRHAHASAPLRRVDETEDTFGASASRRASGCVSWSVLEQNTALARTLRGAPKPPVTPLPPLRAPIASSADQQRAQFFATEWAEPHSAQHEAREHRASAALAATLPSMRAPSVEERPPGSPSENEKRAQSAVPWDEHIRLLQARRSKHRCGGTAQLRMHLCALLRTLQLYGLPVGELAPNPPLHLARLHLRLTSTSETRRP